MTELRALMREHLALVQRLQAALDNLVTPTTTGYLHRNESWTIAFVRDGEHGVELELAIDPPRGAYNWNYPTAERLNELQRKLGADHVHAFALDQGRVRYFASYDRKEQSHEAQ